MKCTACNDNVCEGKYKNRRKCLGTIEDIECACICQVTKNEAYIASAVSVGTGILTAAAGVGLTVATGGMVSIIAGAAIVGAGASFIFFPIQKYIRGEFLTVKDVVGEAAIGATIGAITGPIGAAGVAVANGTSAIASLGIKAAAGSTAGIVTGAVSEGARFINGEEVTLESVAQSMALGAVVKGLGGGSAELANSLSHGITNEVGKAASRIAIQSGSAVATDAGVQLVQNDSIDPKRLLLNTTGQVTIASTAEFSSSVSNQSSSNTNSNMNDKNVDTNKFIPKEPNVKVVTND